MRYRPLGASGIAVSEIGFGTWGLGGNANGAVAYGSTDDAQSIRAVRCALDQGVTFFDTADIYGFGHSEAVLGRALGAERPRAVIATKAGFLDGQGRQDFAPDHLKRALHASLRRLGTDYVDLFQLHDPPIDLLARDETIVAALESLKAQGLLRAYGISARSPADALVAVSELGLRCVQVNFNLADQRALENGLLDACHRLGAGVIVRTPLCFGFLTGRYAPDADFAPDDHRSRWKPEQRRRWTEAARELMASAVARAPDETPAQSALRFCLSFPAVATAIPGMLTEEHVRENVRASELGGLPEQALAEIHSAYGHKSFFVGQ